MRVWLLIVTLISIPGSGPQEFVAGEYQTMERCRLGAEMQMPYWKAKYGSYGIVWTCEVRVQ